MKLTTIIKFIFLVYLNSESNSYASQDSLFIKDYYSKIPNNVILEFAKTRDSSILVIQFRIKWSHNGIVKAYAKVHPYVYDFDFLDDGNIYIPKLSQKFYSSKNFEHYAIVNHMFYEVISPDFFKKNNNQRLRIIKSINGLKWNKQKKRTD